MCGRYVITEEMYEEYERIVRDFEPLLYRVLPQDIRPSLKAPAIIAEDQQLRGRNMTFGFSGFEKGKMLINARSETVREKYTFRDAILNRRCVLPAASFYEWNLQKQKAVFTLPERKLMYLAGIYRQEEDGSHFVILTGAANASMAPVHDRMPLILNREDIASYLQDNDRLDHYLQRPNAMLGYRMDNEQITLF